MRPSKPQYDILTSRSKINLFLAGQGGGKTHCAGAVSAVFISNFPNAKGLIAANTYDQLNRSTMYRIREVWEHEFGIKEYSEQTGEGCYVVGIQPPKHFNTSQHNFDRYNNIVSFDNGAVVYIGSFDNYKALDGMEISWAILDETKDTKEEAIKEVILGRLRQKAIFVDNKGRLVLEDGPEVTPEMILSPFNPLYIFSSPAKVQWINEWFELDRFQEEINATIYSDRTYFRKKIGNKFVTISSAYHNQHNLPSTFIEDQKANLHSGLIDMLIYGNPFSKAGGEFYKCFVREKHTGDYRYNPKLPLHITFDFNVNPYITCLVWQIAGKKAMQIDEICLTTPTNRTVDACREFTRRYASHGKTGLFIYGDPAGKHEDTRTEKGFNDFTVIKSELATFSPTMRVAPMAPAVVMRGNFINTIWEKKYEGIELLIGSNCKNTINDYTYGKEASDGTKLKEKAKDANSGVSYEKFHHCSDANDYFICQAFAAEFTKYQRGGGTPKITTGTNAPGSNHY
jgi:hypothetical protein